MLEKGNGQRGGVYPDQVHDDELSQEFRISSDTSQEQEE